MKKLLLGLQALFSFSAPSLANSNGYVLEEKVLTENADFKLQDVQVSNINRMIDHLILLKIPFQKIETKRDGSGIVRVRELDQLMLAPQELSGGSN